MPGRQIASRAYLGSGLALQNPDVDLRGYGGEMERRSSKLFSNLAIESVRYVDKAILSGVRSRWSW